MKHKSGPICFACLNAQEICSDCRESDFRPAITENLEYEGITWRHRLNIEDDECTKYRRLETEIALAAISRLKAIAAQRKGKEEAEKRAKEAKAQAEEVERICRQQQIKDFRVTSSLCPDHTWVIKARTEYDARLWVAQYMKISFSETQIA